MQDARTEDEGRAGASASASSRSIVSDSRATHVSVPPAAAFCPIRRIGGAAGWYYANWLWRVRGILDKAVGGSGLRKRRNADELRVGDVVDMWRVVAYEPDRLLRLALELRQPGKGWLEFQVSGDRTGSTIRQIATYDPGGLPGRVYWRLVSPLHDLLFAGLLRGIAAAAEAAADATGGTSS